MIPDRNRRGTAKFINASYKTNKETAFKKEVKRYYIQIQAKLAESDIWPFTEKDKLLAYIETEDERLIVEKI